MHSNSKKVKKAKFKKGEIIQRSGEFNSKVYLIKKGLIRSYLIDAKGREHIFMFAPEGWVLSDNVVPSLPTDLFIDALEDSEVLVIEKQHKGNFEFEKIIKRLSVLQKRIIMLLSASAIDRYEHFVENYPDITGRVPQRMIASYLGITPEALSTLKGERRKKKSSENSKS